MVNTYWHDGNLTPGDYLTTSDASTTYVPYTGATGDVTLGTHNLATKEINQYATSEYDGPTLSAEMLDDTGWTSVNWTGSWSTGWQMTGVPATLIRPVTLVAGHEYYLIITGTASNSTINIGGIPTINHGQGSIGSTVYSFTAVDSSDLVYYSGNRSGLKFFSLREKISTKVPIFNIYDSNNIKSLEIYGNDSTLYNTFIGKNSGKSNSIGYENIGLGENALSKIYSGYRNYSSGYNSLFSLLSGYRNVAIGAYSIYSGTSLYDNVGIGAYSLYSSTSGSNNVGIGAYSLYSIIDGGNNVAVGFEALYTSTGSNNTVVGASAMRVSTTGSGNTAVGQGALNQNTTGGGNIAIGYIAGGTLAGYSANINSTHSVFIGDYTKASAANGVNEIVIGYQAAGNGSNTVTLGYTDITKTYLRGDIYPVDGKNLILGTTTGMKIGTATNEKLAFYGNTPIIKPTATTDLGTVLSNLGLRAAGTAYPITTSGAVSFTGTTSITGALTLGYRAITALRTLDTTDYLINCTANSFTVTLPTAASITGRTYIVKNSGTGIITIATTSSQTIDGVTTQTLNRYDSITVVSNGANWIIT